MSTNPYSQRSSSAGGPSGSYIPPSANHFVSSPLASTSTSNPTTTFRAPAHKHAHHLHSIPPREKSTRTLIIDHMLWVHARTRFAQARAELGMTDRTGGPASLNYVHRQRPEGYEEEDEEGSDGEDVRALTSRAGAPHDEDEDKRIQYQDLSLARSLRLRAEGLEKVVTAMLDQPPPHHPIQDEDILTPPTSPKLLPQHDLTHPHALPNGVRLRLALGYVINDLFARQAPPQPYRHKQHTTPSNSNSPSSPRSNAATPRSFTSTQQISHLPPSLASLSTISAVSSMPSLPSSDYSAFAPQPVRSQPPPSPSSRTRSLYMAGADPSTANSPPSFRCPRHLHTGCQICVEAKSAPRPSGGRGRANSFGTGDMGSRSGHHKGSGGAHNSGAGGGGITGWQDGSGVGSGLARHGRDGTVLRRTVGGGEEETLASTGTGNTRLSELIPRFLRLSALVAMELGREARGEEEDVGVGGTSVPREEQMFNSTSSERGWESDTNNTRDDISPMGSVPGRPLSPSSARAQHRMYAYALRPTREWYMLLAGLLTRAVLEGYLTAGWMGLEAVECLLSVGLGIVGTNGKEREILDNDGEGGGDIFERFDPDELPTLIDAAKMLFPALRSGPSARKGVAEEEYETQMDERLRRFYDIPASTPDVATHMEDLAWQYPAEPVERAAARFCEAIAKWRGKPELETYKKKPPPPVDNSAMSMDSLVHSNPTSPTTGHTIPSSMNAANRRPPIEKYFSTSPLRSTTDNLWNRNKRPRSPGDGRAGPSKRSHG